MATYTWTNPVTGDWNTGSLWSGGVAPNAAAADVTIDAPANGAAYTVLIDTGESDVVNTLTLNAVNNLLGVLNQPYQGAELEIDGTLSFAPGSAGVLDGPLQSFVVVDGGTIVNAGMVNGFIQAFDNVLFTGTNGFYVTNWLQSQGTVTIDTKSIAEMSGNVLFDGIYEAQGPGATVNLGGALQNLVVNIATVEGPPAIPEGWTELLFNGTSSAINEWTGTGYQSIEATLTTILNRGTVDVLEGRDYTTKQALTVDGGVFNLQAGTVTTSGITIMNDGSMNGTVKGSGVIVGGITNDASLISGGTGFVLRDALAGTGNVGFIDAASTLEVGAVGAGQTITMQGGDTLKLDSAAAFAGTIAAKVGDVISLTGVTADGATLSGSDLIITNGGSTVATLHLAGSYAGDTFTTTAAGGSASVTVAAAVCYARGTLITTPEGEVPIEQLEPGQEVVTGSGATRPIRWIGRRKVDLRRHPEPRLAQPIRIEAGAFGGGLPRRDLLVSPAHAIYDEGVLIPARFLVNGQTVLQETMEAVEYLHIELDQHEVVLAEGLPAETYLENNDRSRFENSGQPFDLHPDFARWTWDGRAYAELAITGPAFEAVRAKLARIAARKPRSARRRAA